MTQIQVIKNFLKTASDAYYAGTPLISNEEYDALARKYGDDLGGDAGDIPHTFRMYSLQKHYDQDGDYPLDTSKCVETPKFDGAAVSLLYINGVFTLGLTRGDGFHGRDITDKLRLLVPLVIGYTGSQRVAQVAQVTGEVMCLSTTPNARNFCAGALNLDSLAEFKSRIDEGKIQFVAYSVFPYITASYTEDMDFLENYFDTVCHSGSMLVDAGYPTDGIVFRLDSNAAFQEEGFTAKHPKGAFAHKEDDDIYETELLEVIWETGKSGKVTPVAILEPVEIDGAIISRATLNNMAYIDALGLYIGCKVGVVRAGKIIPKIVSLIE